MNLFWIAQGSIAAAAVAALASLGVACSSSSGGGSPLTYTSTETNTDTRDTEGSDGADTCTDYGTNETETCDSLCASALGGTGDNLCPDGAVTAPYEMLRTCASAKCAASCPRFLACGGYGVGADMGCATCLEVQCASQWSACSES